MIQAFTLLGILASTEKALDPDTVQAIAAAVSAAAQDAISGQNGLPVSGWQYIVMTTITAILGGGSTAALVAKWMEYRSAKRKDDQEYTIVQMTRMQARIDHLEKAHEECTKSSVTMAMEVGSLREAVRILTAHAGMQDAREARMPDLVRSVRDGAVSGSAAANAVT